MISPRIQQLLNEQMRNELFSAYFYLSMQTWFEGQSLTGFGNWYDVQVKEERDHALRIRSYLLRVNGVPEFLAIEQPDQQFSGIADVLQRTLAHEQMITAKINELMDCAQSERDYKTIEFLQWYVLEQVEEEENVHELIDRFKMAESSEAGILFMDSELKSRAYTHPQTPQR